METGPTDPKRSKPSDSSSLKYSGLGIQLLVTIGLFTWVGHLIDVYFALTFPVFLLSLMLIALTGNMVLLYKAINKN